MDKTICSRPVNLGFFNKGETSDKKNHNPNKSRQEIFYTNEMPEMKIIHIYLYICILQYTFTLKQHIKQTIII